MAEEATVCATAFPGTGSQFLVPDDSVQDLKSFFMRPTLISRGNLNTAPATLYTLPISWANMVAEIPNWAERLRGVRGIRADLVFTVEHNCNPFHQGILVSAFQYGANQWSRLKPYACTHLPHVRLDVSHNTQSVLRVPFLSEFEYFGSSSSEVGHVMGTFGLVQLLGTPSLAGSNTPVYKVYCHLENIQLFGRVPVAGTTFIVPQSGLATRLNGRSNAEEELASNGQFSGVLATAAKLPKAVGTAFPSLKAFMAPTTWFLNCAAKAASAFGFSKPVPSAPLVRQLRFPNFCENVCDVPAPASVVGAFQTNTVAVSDAVGGTDMDEMAFDNVLTRYSQVFRSAISTSDPHGTVEYVSKTCLTHFWWREPSAGSNRGNIAFPRGSTTSAAVYPTTLLNFAQHFRFWHGGLKFRVTFAKSKFHTGRVMFSFIPDFQQVSTANTYADVGFSGGPVPGLFNSDLQPSQYSMIFDLKDGSEFEFEVPYIAPVSHLGINDSTGFVSMLVMDPLVNNGESSPIIPFIVEVAAMPGFYFAGVGAPGQPTWADTLEPVIQFESGLSDVEFQSGVGASTIEASQVSVGEKFNSLKQIIMLHSPRRYAIANATTHSGTIPFWTCVPAWGDGNLLVSGGTRNWALPRSGMIAQCYAYGIGSTLLYWHCAPNTNSGAKVVLNQSDNNTTTVGTVPSMYTQALTSPTRAYAQIMQNQWQGMFMLPMLSTTPRFRMGDFNTGTNARDWNPDSVTPYTTSSTSVKAIYNWLNRNDNGSSVQGAWSVAAADDARCAAYIGPPPMILANAASANAVWWSGNPI